MTECAVSYASDVLRHRGAFARVWWTVVIKQRRKWSFKISNWCDNNNSAGSSTWRVNARPMDQWEAEVVCAGQSERRDPCTSVERATLWWETSVPHVVENLEQLWNQIKEVQKFVKRMSGDEETSLQELYTKAANAKRALTRAKKELQDDLK